MALNIRNESRKEFANVRKDIDGLKADLGGIAGPAKNAGDSIGRIDKVTSFASIKQGLSDIGSGLDGIKTKILDLTTASSGWAESVGKAEIVFGEEFANVKKIADGAAESLGLSKAGYLEAAATFGNLFVSMGMNKKQAADMSIEIVQLGVDLAAFNNIPIDDVLIKLRAGLVGETEPLRTLGVNLTADTIKAKALSDGLAPLVVDVSKVKDAELELAKARKDLAEASDTSLKADDKKVAKWNEERAELRPLRAEVDQLREAYARAERGGAGTNNRAKILAELNKAEAAYNKQVDKTKDAFAAFQPKARDAAEDALKIADAQRDVEKAEAKLAAARKGAAGDLTAQAKAQSAFKLILEQTTTAQGNDAATKEGLAGQTKRLKAEQEELRIEVGEKLVPAHLALIGMYRELPVHVQVAGFALTEFGGSALQVGAGLGQMAMGFPAFGAALGKLGPALMLAKGHFLSLGMTMLLPPMGFVVALVAAGVAIYLFRDQIMGVIGPIKDAVVGFGRDAYKAIVGTFKDVIAWGKDNWKEIAVVISGPFAPLVALATDGFGIRTALIGFFKGLPNTVKEGAIDIARALRGVIQDGLDMAAARIKFTFPGIKIAGKTIVPAGSVGFPHITIPSFARGADLIQRDQLAVVHKGERIITARAARNGDTDRGGNAGGVAVYLTGNVTVNNGSDLRKFAGDAGYAVGDAIRRRGAFQ